MIYPGGWNEIEISAPRPIKPIVAVSQIYDGTSTINGELVLSSDYFTPTGNWIPSPFSVNDEPKVFAVNNAMFQNELFKAEAMNQQTKMVNLTNPPPPMSNLMFLYGNRNGDLKYQMKIELDFDTGNYAWLELSVMENAAGSGGPNGLVEAYHFAKTSGNFTGVNTLYLFFDNFFGQVNLGLRAESTLPDSSIFEMQCIILDADIV